MSNPWEEISKPVDDIHVRRADDTHQFDFFWGKDIYGHYLFIYQAAPDLEIPGKLPPLKGLDISIHRTDLTRLVLKLKERTDWEMFLALCKDLLLATKSLQQSESVVPVLVRRLTRWQEFLQKEKSGILPEAAIKGLIGELLFIERKLMPVYGISDSVRFWQGPEGAPQDFNIGDAAVEVKCQSGSSAPIVLITSSEQLCPQLPEMYLYVVTLGKAPDDFPESINLLDLVNQIRSRFETENPNLAERFNDLLQSTGYIDLEAYKDFCYVLSAQWMFEVREGFPRICPSVVPEGVTKVSYAISLDQCMPFSSEPEWLKGVKS